MRTFENLKIWQRGVDLATHIYRITSSFPKEEKFGLISQMRRCSVSFSSNIAEGASRSSDKEFKRFLEIAYGSLYELHTQIVISKNLNLINEEKFEVLETEIIELQKMTFIFAKQLGQTNSS